MEMTGMAIERILADPFTIAVVIVAVSSVVLILLLGHSFFNRGVKLSVSCENSSVPRVPGLPLLGNLLQLKEKKPYKTFTKWSELYGPVYSIQLGSSQLIVLNTSDVAKEAMVTRFSSISTRKLSNALTILTNDKCMVATSDYNDFHKTVKRYIINYLLGSNAQKRNRKIRETMLEDVVDRFNAHIESSPLQAVNFRKIFESELFGLALKQAIGRDLQSLYVEELGTNLTRKEIFHILVLDMMEGAIEVDWRDFFPYLRWVPNNKVETKIRKLAFRRNAVVKALIKEHKGKNEGEKEMDSFLDFLLSEANDLTETQLAMLLWEPIIESSDTTLISTEWALFELSKDPVRQERLYREIEAVCGSDKVTEDHLSKLPYLSAVFHETLRKHSPVPMIPIRYVHEDTQIGGYHIPAGTEIIVNLYGCNRDNNQWENPEEWIPERFLAKDKYDPHDLYKTMAFGAGKRVCAGSLQAMLISCTAIGRLVQEFVWSLQPGQEEDIDTVGLTTHKLHPLHAILHHRRRL